MATVEGPLAGLKRTPPVEAAPRGRQRTVRSPQVAMELARRRWLGHPAMRECGLSTRLCLAGHGLVRVPGLFSTAQQQEDWENPMSRIEWRIDAGTHIVLRNPLFMRRKVELNGQPVDGEWQSKRFAFTLPDGRAADITLKADTISRTTELSLEGKLIPDTRYVPKDLQCPSCKAEIQLLDEFCAKCGHSLGTPARFLHRHSVQGATNAIWVLAVLFALFGIVMFFLMKETTETALTNLAAFEDHEVLEPIDGVTYTAGELRKQVLWEHRGILVVNLLLAAIMVVLAWWSKQRALPAILIATAIFVVVQVTAAIVDPKTLMQGIIMKAVVIAVLIRGIKGAISAADE
jgi:hypothetical protein